MMILININYRCLLSWLFYVFIQVSLDSNRRPKMSLVEIVAVLCVL